jgi:hypothetical protein
MTSNFGSGYGWKIAAIDSSGVPLVFAQRQNSATWTESMRIDTSGNVGIGTSSPASKLQVVGQSGFGNGASNSAATISTSATGNDAVTLELATGSGSPFSLSLFANGASPANAVYLNQRNNAPIVFNTNNTERMRIDSSGNTFIGGTTGFGRLVVNASASDIYLGYNGATKQFAVDGAGQIYAQFTTITSLSDRRAKENIKPIQYGLNEILKLNPVTFNFIAYPQFGPTYGFIAQEVEPLLPELVGNEKDNKAEDGTPYKTLKMGDMLPVMVKAIQELKATVDAQAARIAALESK